MQKYTIGDLLVHKNKRCSGQVVQIKIMERKDGEGNFFIQIDYTIESHGCTQTFNENDLVKFSREEK